MTDRALVIGLDHYENEAWELKAAVRDALAFAAWVTEPGAGRATAATLTLLLSPHPDRPVKGVNFQPATRDAIQQALYTHTKNGVGAQRLWFFYAGHGLAPAGGGPDEAPVVVPADVEDLDYYRWQPIDLGSWIRQMQVCSPQHQVFFVDACRGIVVSEDTVTATRTLFFDLSKMASGGPARQAVLFATTAGQLANEQGLHGLFGGALINGLQGQGPTLEPDAATQEFVLTFDGLTSYAKRRIQLASDKARRGNSILPTQEPAGSLFGVQGSLEIARFKEKPRSSVKVFVVPEGAAAEATAGIRGYNEWKRVFERQGEKSSPLAVPVEWKLSSSNYLIEIEAPGYKNWTHKVDVIGPMELSAALEPNLVVAFESTKETRDQPRGGHELPERPDGAELAAGARGSLVVQTPDRYTRIEVFNLRGKRVKAAWGGLQEMLPVGSYRLEIALPTERPTVRRVLVTATEPEAVEVHPDPQLTQRLPASAGMIWPHDGVTDPSEAFGTATTTHLGSLLAWAAAAAQFDPDGHGQKLRKLGVERLPTTKEKCFVRLLVGDAMAPPVKGPMETLHIELGQQAAVLKQPLPALAGFAKQWHAEIAFDTSLTIGTAELNLKRMPLPFIAGHVWTIVIVRETTQGTEIHRYLHPLEPEQPFDDTIRLIEQNWRALEARAPLHDDEAERLLERQLDPLSLAVLGYRLALESRQEDLAKVVERLGNAPLADTHVLAALLGERDKRMARALRSSSVPVVGEGYRLMEAWLTDHFAKENLPPPIAPEPFTGGLWTAFDLRGQAVISKAFTVRNAPAWAKPLLAAADATARIEGGPDGAHQLIGTGFLIGPRKLALMDVIWELKPKVAVFGDERAGIEAILGTTNDDRHAALARIAPVARAPMKIKWSLPAVGTRIAVIGHPMLTFTPTVATMAAFTTPPRGEKMIMPGVIVAVEETKLTYECWTMAGTGGGPIIDLATGEVIGIHHSGKYGGGAMKLGFGVPLAAIEALLKTPI
ncbi:MAG: hypothetical protein JWR51_3446 [Devosia sp.]|uniref:caspase family protein n=1 Tax=Devosia sp. TaxID=1871048 RepID=UPI002614517C|nr:caspase family protein [Devosia sp.]MDB5530343.1 hypothetical protein [Devosia sp.]